MLKVENLSKFSNISYQNIFSFICRFLLKNNYKAILFINHSIYFLASIPTDESHPEYLNIVKKNLRLRNQKKTQVKFIYFFTHFSLEFQLLLLLKRRSDTTFVSSSVRFRNNFFKNGLFCIWIIYYLIIYCWMKDLLEVVSSELNINLYWTIVFKILQF